jgi:antiphage defense system Thoeris ThsB-like protein
LLFCPTGQSTITHHSAWVTWELETAIERGKLIVAMAAQGVSRVTLPIPIRNKGVPFYSWNPSKLKTYLDHAPVVG